jgi:ElaB/YqjD/DUF883 family membrane-anchored ribosome-binding protein
MPDTSASAVRNDALHADALESLDQTRAAAEKSIQDLARRAEKAIHEGIETLRANSRGYVDTAGDRFDEAQKYVVERVHEKPMSATLAALGIGVVVGLLLSSGRRH